MSWVDADRSGLGTRLIARSNNHQSTATATLSSIHTFSVEANLRPDLTVTIANGGISKAFQTRGADETEPLIHAAASASATGSTTKRYLHPRASVAHQPSRSSSQP